MNLKNLKKEKKRGAKSLIFAVGIVLLVVFFVLTSLALKDSPAIDEMVHIPAGYLHTYQGDYRYNAEHPPLANDLSGLFAGITRPNVPQIKPIDQWQFGRDFIYGPGQNADDIVFWGRYPIILLTLVLLFLIFIWSKALWGVKGGIISLLLAASCPNLLSHGHYATTDLILALSYTLNFYVLWKFFRHTTWLNAVFLGFTMGFVILSKFSGLMIIPVNLAFLYIFVIAQRKNYFLNIKKILISFLIAIFILWLVYAFSMRYDLSWLFYNHYGLNHFNLQKDYLIDWVKLILWPFKKYKEGFDIVSSHNAGGHFSYLNGVFSQDGRREYFFYAFFYKTPIPAMILFFMAILHYFKNKFAGTKDAFYFVLVPAIIFFLFSVLGNLNIGLRHALPVYPLAFIFIGVLGTMKSKIWHYLAYFLVVLNIIIAVWTYPQYLAYFNQAAGGTPNGYKYLSDSNLDWGQNTKRLGEYLKENQIDKIYFDCYDPGIIAYYGVEYHPIPKIEPVKGVIAMCTQQYLLSQNTTDYLWFINEKPTKIVDETIYLWDKSK